MAAVRTWGGIAVIYLGACTSVSSASTAAHELLHTFGALAGAAAPNACAESGAHVCDSSGDILYPFAQPAPLASFVLDLNRDDYYGHGRSWFDVRDSAWLRHLDAQVPLSLVLRGRGTVTSDAPGVGCAVSCRSEWTRARSCRCGRSRHAASASSAGRARAPPRATAAL